MIGAFVFANLVVAVVVTNLVTLTSEPWRVTDRQISLHWLTEYRSISLKQSVVFTARTVYCQEFSVEQREREAKDSQVEKDKTDESMGDWRMRI